MADLLDTLRLIGADKQVVTLLARNPAAHIAFDSQDAVASLVNALRRADAGWQITALLDRDPATHVRLDNPNDSGLLVYALRLVHADEQVAKLVSRDPATDSGWFTIDDDIAIARWDYLGEGQRPRPGAPINWRYEGGYVDGIVSKFRTALNHPDNAVRQQSAAEADLYIADYCLDDPCDVATLLDVLRAAGADYQIATLLGRNPAAHVMLEDTWMVNFFLQALRDVRADQQIAILFNRDLAANVSLDKAREVAWLLVTLRDMGADEQVARLISRDPSAHVALNKDDVPYLLNALREIGADQQFTDLASRLLSAGFSKSSRSISNLGSDSAVNPMATLLFSGIGITSTDYMAGTAR